jgi:hypothetical protein
MPSSALDIPTWVRPDLTKEHLDYAVLARVDLDKFWQGPQKKAELVEDLRTAVNTGSSRLLSSRHR